MKRQFYQNLTQNGLSNQPISHETAKLILEADEVELLPLLNAAYTVRQKFMGQEITVHIINNAQNGFCPEDCHYCAQAKTSGADINEYPLKSDDEILAEAKNAYDKGAHRYCMVFAGRGPSMQRTRRLAGLIRSIKQKYPLEVCVSAGLVDDVKAQVLKEAGLDRLNHNLNTSEKHYPAICSTHTYQDRLNTLTAARKAGLDVCSGVILGMGESLEDVIETAFTLRKIEARSIPVNFFIPIKGAALKDSGQLSPEYCLKVLCVYRLANPDAEIRIAAGRELHLRSMEVMALYPANSLFLDGYLNAKGAQRKRTLQMIKDAGFSVKSDRSLDELIGSEIDTDPADSISHGQEGVQIKSVDELRPQMNP